MRNAIVNVMVVVALSVGAGACGYAGIASAGDAAIVARNDWFLFGLLRKVYVCKVTPAGLTQCSNAETP
jgi:hypothetical protein